MASTYSNLKIQLMTTGENSGTWGNVTNDNLGVAIEQALVETATVTFASANVTLTLTNTNAAQNARALRLDLTGTTAGARDLIVPAIQKPYIVNNGTADTITIKVSGQTGVAIPAGKTTTVYNNGTDVVDMITHLSSLSLSTDLAVADGGTGSSTLTAENVIIGNGTAAVKFVAPGTASNVLTSNGTAWVSQAVGGGFAAGTVMLFAQTSAPTGWTKNTSTGNNSTLRVVTGTASTGGNVDFATVFVSNRAVNISSLTGSAGATTLTTPQIPSHTHPFNTSASTNNPTAAPFNPSGYGGTVFQPFGSAVGAAGGGGSHTHPLTVTGGSGTVDLDVKYVDIIRATKD